MLTLEEQLLKLQKQYQMLEATDKDSDAEDQDGAIEPTDAQSNLTDKSDPDQDGDDDSNEETDTDDDSNELSGAAAIQAKANAQAKMAANESKQFKVDLGSLFEGTEFTEEFKSKAEAIFEAAVEVRAKQVGQSLYEAYYDSLKEEVESEQAKLVNEIDGYLGYISEQWMEANELAVTNGVKNEILESFLGGIKGVFESHYIDVPDEKYDLIESIEKEKEKLEKSLEEEITRNTKLHKSLLEIKREVQISEAAADLSATDAERFNELAAAVQYDSDEAFKSKLMAIKENYFTSRKKSVSKNTTTFITDQPVITEGSLTESVDPSISKYLRIFESKQ